MKKLIHDIQNGKNIEENLIRCRNTAVPLYSEYAALELTFSAYTMVQELTEQDTAPPESGEDAGQILKALADIGRESADYSSIAEKMEKIRSDITAKMDLLTAYTDRMILYEYVKNRLEFSFEPEEVLRKKIEAVNEETLLRDITAYLYYDKKKGVDRERLSLVVGQIPVQMTKSRLFELVGETLTLYKGGDRSALDDFLYMLRTSSTVYEPSYPKGHFLEIEKILDELSGEPFLEMDRDRYEALAAMLEDASRYLRSATDCFCSLQKVANGIYALCLLLPYMGETSGLIRGCAEIWEKLAGRECRDEMLVPLEGKIEPYVEKIGRMDSVLYEIKSVYGSEARENGQADFFGQLSRASNLLSDSLFIDLEKAEGGEKADGAYIKECTEQFLDELSVKMERVPRPLKRAMTAALLQKLPVLFRTMADVEGYIRVNLLGCHDKKEKAAAISIISDLVRDEV